MEKAKNLIKYSSIINFVITAFYLFSTPIIGIIFAVISILLWIISEESDEELSSYLFLLHIFGCIMFLSNIISAILLWIAIGDIKKMDNENQMNAPPKKIIKKVIDPEIKKIDVLLKLGVGMVLISGILFATTSWQSISMEWKAIGLLLLGCLFLFLSFFTEKRLKIYMTTYMYWLLSMSFFSLTIVGALYFGIFNIELTYIGAKKELAYAITSLTIGGLSLASYLKFSKNYLAYLSYLSFLSMLWFLLNSFLPTTMTMIIMSTILLCFNIINKKNILLFDITKMVTYISFIIILANIKDSNSIQILVTCLINIINLYYLTFIDQDNESTLHLIIIYILSSIAVFNLDLSSDYHGIIMFIYATLQTIFIATNILKQKKEYHQLNYALYSICSIISFFSVNMNMKDFAFIIPSIYLLMNIIFSLDLKSIETINYAPYLGPISILVFVYSIIEKYLTQTTIYSYVLIITTMIYCLVNFIIKKENIRVLYKISIAIGIIASIETNILEKDSLPALLAMIPSFYLFMISFKNRKEENRIMAISYILFLICIYNVTTLINVLKLNIIISSLIFIWILLINMLLLKDKTVKNISLFVIIIPIYDIIQSLTMNTEYRSIMISILTLYVTFLIVIYFCKEKEFKNIIGIIGIIISLFEVIAIPTLSIGIYIGIVGIIVILLGYYFSKELPSFFSTGIIITILNIIYQLKDLWGLIPFWLYLLLGGLSLLFFVTYKEIKKTKKK